MTTIFTDDFSYENTDISLGDPHLGRKGRELIFTTASDREFRVNLSDDQLKELADVLLLNGYVPTNEPEPNT